MYFDPVLGMCFRSSRDVIAELVSYCSKDIINAAAAAAAAAAPYFISVSPFKGMDLGLSSRLVAAAVWLSGVGHLFKSLPQRLLARRPLVVVQHDAIVVIAKRVLIC